MNKQLILLQKKIALKKLPSIIHDNDLCYLLSKDYSSYLKLNKIVPDNCKVLNLAGKFNRQIERLRIPYLDLFARLNKQHNSLEWWCSHIASKQSASTPLQLNITYLFCAKDIIYDFINSHNQKRIIFIADSQALIDSIANIGKRNNIEVFLSRTKVYKLIKMVSLLVTYISRVAFFIVKSYYYRRFVPLCIKPEFYKYPEKRKIIIRSWVTQGTLDNKGVFKDRNFGTLVDWLKSKGYVVMILPMFFNLNKSIKEMRSLIKKQNIDFIIQERYLKLIDFIRAIYMAWKQIKIPLNNISLESTDLTLLFREIQFQEGFGLGALSAYLSNPLLKRFKDMGFEIDRFYYPFENNLPEKPFVLGCKKYFPDSEVIGYQHTAWHKNQLGQFLGTEEAKFHPIADKIICSGPIYLDILKNAGFPPQKLVLGPNLRFTSIHQKHHTSKQDIKRPNILLLLTYDNDLAYDLIHKVQIISKVFPESFIYIRRHFLLNYKKLEEFINEINFENFEYADMGTIQDWFLNTDIVITSAASIANIETVVKGVPLIMVEPDNNFFLNPLAWSDYPLKPVNSPDEIINAVQLIMDMKKEDRNRLKELGSNILSDYFSEMNNNTMKVFN